jgi:hypothetical protein
MLRTVAAKMRGMPGVRAVQLVAGSLLALGRPPRLAALAIAAAQRCRVRSD